MLVTTRLKPCVVNEESSMLWYQRLGHISIERIKQLVNEGVLSTLDFADFETCVDWIKGKQTNKSKKGAKRSSKYHVETLERRKEICILTSENITKATKISYKSSIYTAEIQL